MIKSKANGRTLIISQHFWSKIQNVGAEFDSLIFTETVACFRIAFKRHKWRENCWLHPFISKIKIIIHFKIVMKCGWQWRQMSMWHILFGGLTRLMCIWVANDISGLKNRSKWWLFLTFVVMLVAVLASRA